MVDRSRAPHRKDPGITRFAIDIHSSPYCPLESQLEFQGNLSGLDLCVAGASLGCPGGGALSRKHPGFRGWETEWNQLVGVAEVSQGCDSQHCTESRLPGMPVRPAERETTQSRLASQLYPEFCFPLLLQSRPDAGQTHQGAICRMDHHGERLSSDPVRSAKITGGGFRAVGTCNDRYGTPFEQTSGKRHDGWRHSYRCCVQTYGSKRCVLVSFSC